MDFSACYTSKEIWVVCIFSAVENYPYFKGKHMITTHKQSKEHIKALHNEGNTKINTELQEMKEKSCK